jgi:hypothetical protein
MIWFTGAGRSVSTAVGSLFLSASETFFLSTAETSWLQLQMHLNAYIPKTELFKAFF